MRNKIYIYTDGVHSGKTTRLQKWLRNNDIKAAGILSPDREGKRHLYDVAADTYLPFEVDDDRENILMVGKYRFSQQSFTAAQAILIDALSTDPEWLIVDEVGRLELDRKTGLEPAITHLVNHYKTDIPSGSLMLVVRTYLLDEAVAAYGLNTDMIIHQSFFE